LEECLVREIREELDIEIAVGALMTTVRHAYTHFRVTLHVFHCRYLSGEPQALGCADWRWVRPDELDGFAFPAADRRIIVALQGM
jgi:A/G-specific adenine glycosylase